MNILESINNERDRIIDNRNFHNYYIEKYRMRLTDKQRAVIESKETIVKQNFYRQEGCSTIALIKAIEYAEKNPNCKVLLVYPSGNMLRMMNNYLNELLDRCHIHPERNMISRSNNVSVMELPNHSVIKMATGNVEHLRGESINCLILDGERYFNNYSKEILIAATLRDENRQVVLLNQSDIYRGNE